LLSAHTLCHAKQRSMWVCMIVPFLS
jgi:hypothetical protein